MKQKFYRCNVCGQVVNVICDTNLPIRCCMRDMEELIPNTRDAALEKHVPDVEICENMVCVNVGSIDHPMTADHYVTSIFLQTTHGCQRIDLVPADKPRACFYLAKGEKPEAVYEYCNLHGLWMVDLTTTQKDN